MQIAGHLDRDVIQWAEPARLTDAPFDEGLNDVAQAEALQPVVEVGMHLAVHGLLADESPHVLTPVSYTHLTLPTNREV